MTSINYPSTLPAPTIAKNSHSETSRLLRTQMDSGYSVVRKRFTTVPADFSVSFIFTQTQLQIFQYWHADVLDYGIEWFNMDLAVGAGINSSHECRFYENIKYTLNGRHWRVDATLEAVQLNRDAYVV